MKVALITPFDLLDLAALSDYHLLLPQHFPNETYRRFYGDVKGFKILDNGAAEGYAADYVELHDLGQQWGVNEIVVPDALQDCNRTIELARRFEPHVRSEFGYVGVAQGQTLAEVIKCITYFSFADWITTLALPRSLNQIHWSQRFTILEPLVKEYKFDAIHCLGGSGWIREIVALQGSGLVRGMDTSLPVVLGLASKTLMDDEYVSRQPNYFDVKVERNSYLWEVIYDNVRTYLEWGGVSLLGDEASPGGEV